MRRHETRPAPTPSPAALPLAVLVGAAGPSWSQGAGSDWLLLRGPGSEYWFNKWLVHLEANGGWSLIDFGIDRIEVWHE